MDVKYLRGIYHGGTKVTMLESLYHSLSDTDKADVTNLVTLAYLTDQELQKRNLAITTMHLYRCNGFNYIVQHCTASAIYHYNKKVIAKLVADAFERYKNGDICHAAVKDLRRVAAMLEEFHDTGQLTWRKLSPWHKRIPKGEFNIAVEAFRRYQAKHGTLVEPSIRSNCNCAAKFLCFLEDKGYPNFESLSLPILSCETTEYLKRYSKNGIRNQIKYLQRFFSVIGRASECEFNTTQDFSVAIPRMAAPHRYVKRGFFSD